MTADEFFRICEICYDANDYFKTRKEDLSRRGKYLSMADGRDAGLRNIDGDSPQAFQEWYHSGDNRGSNPTDLWVFCRPVQSSNRILGAATVLYLSGLLCVLRLSRKKMVVVKPSETDLPKKALNKK